MTKRPLLTEIAESTSEGDVAALYARIRATLGIPFVGLIYRTLAAEPGRLALVWAQLEPFFAHPDTREAAATLDPGVEPIPASAGVGEPAIDLSPEYAARAAATLAAYDHMNRLNLMGMSALLHPDRAHSRSTRSALTPIAARWSSDDLLPMTDPSTLQGEDRDLLLQISEKILPGTGPILVPSLLRHFAGPGLLAQLWTSIRPAVDSVQFKVATEDLRRQAAEVPTPAGLRLQRPADAAILETCARFEVATSTMIVMGALLGRALGLPARGATELGDRRQPFRPRLGPTGNA